MLRKRDNNIDSRSNIMLLRNASNASISIWGLIDHFLSEDINEFDYSIDELCKMTGRGRSTTRKGLDDLISYGVLKEIVRPSKTTLYKIIGEIDIMTPEKWEEDDPDHLSTHYHTKEARKKTISRPLD
jgi:hypothetical protein